MCQCWWEKMGEERTGAGEEREGGGEKGQEGKGTQRVIEKRGMMLESVVGQVVEGKGIRCPSFGRRGGSQVLGVEGAGEGVPPGEGEPAHEGLAEALEEGYAQHR